MKGKYSIEIYNNRVHYYLRVERNITLIRGDSATGKSELVRLLTLYLNNGASSGITLLCDKACVVLDNARWRQEITENRQSILFADEGSSFLQTKEFAEAIRGNDNYFVLITRESLPQLPYSITEIYGMRMNTGSKYHGTKRIYNELYRLYHLDGQAGDQTDLILTEDSNSGRDFFQAVSSEEVRSTNGKSNVINEIDRYSDRHILVIVDGAAFGPEISRVLDYLRDTGVHAVLYAPESFEYLILKADILDHTSKVTADTFQYADSRLYMSWEEFYTTYLQEQAQNTIYQYSKHQLNPAYLTTGNKEKILRQLPPYVQESLNKKNEETYRGQ